jgi:hypothetical protein
VSERCDWMLPEVDVSWRVAGQDENDHPVCELPAEHDGPHLCTMPNGMPYWWEQNVCDCAEYCDTFASRTGPKDSTAPWAMHWNCDVR